MNFPRVPAGKRPRIRSSRLVSSFWVDSEAASGHLLSTPSLSVFFGSLLAIASSAPLTLRFLLCPEEWTVSASSGHSFQSPISLTRTFSRSAVIDFLLSVVISEPCSPTQDFPSRLRHLARR